VLEFQEVMPRLAQAGFSLVIPSLPGHGWSGRPPRPIGPARVAAMWRSLMVDVLGYPRFFAQGGDWGSAVTTQLGISHADVVAAIHLNFFMAPPPGPDADAELLAYWGAVGKLMEAESGYQHEHATKPQTIGLALHDNQSAGPRGCGEILALGRHGRRHRKPVQQGSSDHQSDDLSGHGFGHVLHLDV
jgi:pimeloyl-ACP methyl ester carboxylesterase